MVGVVLWGLIVGSCQIKVRHLHADFVVLIVISV